MTAAGKTAASALIGLLCLVAAPGWACTLAMGFGPEERGSLIGAAGQETGLYTTYFREAAARIGCQLTIVRQPKARVHAELSRGKIDFYPAVEFTKERQRYLLFMPNGLFRHKIGLSRDDLPEVTGVAQLKGKRVLIDNANSERGTELGQIMVELGGGKLTVERAIELLRLGRGDFRIADEEDIKDYFRATGLGRATTPGIRFHENCCGGREPGHIGFSRRSPHYAEQPNPQFRPDQPTGFANQPVVATPGTVAARLAEVLAKGPRPPAPAAPLTN